MIFKQTNNGNKIIDCLIWYNVWVLSFGLQNIPIFSFTFPYLYHWLDFCKNEELKQMPLGIWAGECFITGWFEEMAGLGYELKEKKDKKPFLSWCKINSTFWFSEIMWLKAVVVIYHVLQSHFMVFLLLRGSLQYNTRPESCIGGCLSKVEVVM